MKMMATLRTASLTVTDTVIRAYADLSSDYNPIHLDPVFAAATPMGGVIAHGTMSMGLLWQALFASFGADAFAHLELDVRFVRPVRGGETITAGGELADAAAGTYAVWVRGDDGADRIAGTVTLAGMASMRETRNPDHQEPSAGE